MRPAPLLKDPGPQENLPEVSISKGKPTIRFKETPSPVDNSQNENYSKTERSNKVWSHLENNLKHQNWLIKSVWLRHFIRDSFQFIRDWSWDVMGDVLNKLAVYQRTLISWLRLQNSQNLIQGGFNNLLLCTWVLWRS